MKASNLKPVQGYILVKEQPDEEKAFFKMPETTRVSLQKAMILAVSEDVDGYEPEEVVIYAKNNGHEVEPGIKFILVVDLISKVEE